jgi:hypothetical protein
MKKLEEEVIAKLVIHGISKLSSATITELADWLIEKRDQVI